MEAKALIASKLARIFRRVYGEEVVMACFARTVNDTSGFSARKFFKLLAVDMVSKAAREEVVQWYKGLVGSFLAKDASENRTRIPRVVNACVGGPPNLGVDRGGPFT